MPRFEWRDEDMAGSLSFFPFVGIIIGALIFLLNALPQLKAVPVAVRVLLTVAIPLLITGGFHTDGFMDTSDALSSYASREKKLEILKDPHIGAFAVIAMMRWLLLFGAAVTMILTDTDAGKRYLAVFGLVFVISRCLSGLTSIHFKKAKSDGMLSAETKGKPVGVTVFLIIQLILATVFSIVMNPVAGAVVIVTYAAFIIYYRHMTYKKFGGVTGDTAGYFLTEGEMLASLFLAVYLFLF